MSEPAGQFGRDERGGDPPADAGSADPGSAGTGSADALTYPHCSRCHADLTHCFLSARFCPRCGLLLTGLEAETPPPAPQPVPPPPLAVLALDPSEGSDTHSLILGYANAMFRLGWRYENGHGTSHNAEEAVRCYFKAAKLGNCSARARLTTRQPQEPALPGDVAPPQPDLPSLTPST